MRNICLVISYDGTAYYGYQSQPGQNTIQDKLERSIRYLTGEHVKTISSGRTDSGVHAKAQVVNFLTSSLIPMRRWCLVINDRLPRDIVVLSAKEVSLDFHARRWAKTKTYRYTINNYRFLDVFQRKYQYHHPTSLDVEAMQQALKCILGEHDFTSFCSEKSRKISHVRTIFEARLEHIQEPRPDHLGQIGGLLHIIITGSGFLYNMVRIIAGTLLEIGEGKKSVEAMSDILNAVDRSKAGPTAVAHGLILWDVTY